MDRMRTVSIILIAMLSIFSACKEKEEEVDKCQNGFLDPGESGIDCGGNCDPCIPYEPASLYLECNGTPLTFSIKTLEYDNSTWTLSASNDSLYFQFNLGTNGSIGTYIMNPIGCYATKNGTSYLNTSNGQYSISAHDLDDQKLSGFFQADFSRTGFIDTLRIRNGQFEFLPY